MQLRIATVVLTMALFTIVAVSCANDQNEPSDDQLIVTTTTYPITYFTQRIGGERVAITQLIKPGVEAHDFEPAPSDVRAIIQSDLFIFNHPEFESWALDAATTSNADRAEDDPLTTVQTVDLEHHGEADEEHIETGENHGGQELNQSELPEASHEDHDADEDEHDHIDAHVWLNPIEAQEQVEAILSALNEANPAGSTTFNENADALILELKSLDDRISGHLGTCEFDRVVVSHLAYGHMAERYGFHQVGLAGLSPEFESGPSQIASVIQEIDELGIGYILQEPIIDDRLAQTVSAETGVELLTLHPLEVRTKDEAERDLSYFDIMNSNADALKMAMRCS